MPRNLIDLKVQYFLANLVILAALADQIFNIIIQANYDEIGIETTFLLWWSKFYLENIGNYWNYLTLSAKSFSVVKVTLQP